MKKGSIKFILLILFITGVFVAARFSGLGEYLTEDFLKSWIAGFGIMGPLVYILIYLAAPSFMVPGLALTVIGGILFGPVWGTVYVITGATAGATVAFLVSRYMGREWVEARLTSARSERIRELDQRVQKDGWKIVAFTRLIPLFPFNLLNYAFGLTKVKTSHFIIASFIFMLPGTIAYVVFSSSFLGLLGGKVSKEFIIGVLLVLAVSLIPLLYRKFRSGH